MRRVLRPGGRLLLSVPFGEYRNWGAFQQFDVQLLNEAMDAFRPVCHENRFYRYTPDGWQAAPSAECTGSRYSEFALGQWVPEHRNRRLTQTLQPEQEPSLAVSGRSNYPSEQTIYEPVLGALS